MSKLTLDLDRRTIIALRSLALERGIVQTRGPHVGDGNISGYLDAIMRAHRNKRRADMVEVAEMILENDPDLNDLGRPAW